MLNKIKSSNVLALLVCYCTTLVCACTANVHETNTAGPVTKDTTECASAQQPYSCAVDISLQENTLASVYDGDTFRINLNCNNALFCQNLPIRVNGIDTPELKTKNKCEKDYAIKAKTFTTNFLKSGKIKLTNCKRGKYFRLVCDVEVNKTNLANELLKNGLAYPYDGGTKQKPNWCKEDYKNR